MNVQIISNALHGVRKAVSQHSPELLTGLGIAGMVTAIAMAVNATPKAMAIVEEREVEEERTLTKKEVVCETWKCYIPTAVVSISSVACIVGASAVNKRRNAALAAAYALSESTLTQYRDKVVQVVGEKKERAVRDAVAQEQVENKPVQEQKVIVTGHGETLCFDPISGRYFKSDAEFLRKVANDLNRRMRDEMCISLNDLYSELNLEETRISGEMLGWNIDKGYIEFVFSSHLTQNNTPCLVLDYAVPPKYGFDQYC